MWMAVAINLRNIDADLKTVVRTHMYARDMRIMMESGLISHYHILHGTSLFSTSHRHPEATLTEWYTSTDTYLRSDRRPKTLGSSRFYFLRATIRRKVASLKLKWNSDVAFDYRIYQLFSFRAVPSIKPVRLVGRFTYLFMS